MQTVHCILEPSIGLNEKESRVQSCFNDQKAGLAWLIRNLNEKTFNFSQRFLVVQRISNLISLQPSHSMNCTKIWKVSFEKSKHVL